MQKPMVDDQVREVLRRAAGAPHPADVKVEEARRGLLAAVPSWSRPKRDVASVRDVEIPTSAGFVRLRLYEPDIARPAPAILYLHGGGWVRGSIETHDGLCRELAADGRCVVVSVDYRLAPENPYPAPLEDTWAALQWLANEAPGVDRSRIAVAGDSAGGTLAVALTLRAREEGGPAIAFQLLAYPPLDAACATPSFTEHAEGAMLTAAAMRWYWAQYAPDPETAASPYVSPLRANDLEGLPPAFVLTCELDPVRDDGGLWADRLRAAGVAVEHRRYPAMHIMLLMDGILEVARRARADLTATLRRALRVE
ncbi:Esterase/lipase [Labilithrix luteola]|uniref:Esterase/lipase n=1 Tax=Labilithrix luteola TaxID=1391654 RepID=A0A0K1Q5E7_9BACT|nr:alpha/beta hydrolase [Labilithrix luteola]AKV00877.1 Esterase/lipase [Labilithrix luteola]